MRQRLNRLLGRLLTELPPPPEEKQYLPSVRNIRPVKQEHIPEGDPLPRGQVTLILEYDLVPSFYPMDAPDEQVKCDQRSWDDGNIELEYLILKSRVKSATFELPEK